MIKPREYTSRQNWNHWFWLDIKLNILTKTVFKSQDWGEKCCQENNEKTYLPCATDSIAWHLFLLALLLSIAPSAVSFLDEVLKHSF